MKIYTKKGDAGSTSLIGGKRVPKHHLRIDAYGTVDELNSFIGVLHDQSIDEHHRQILAIIQDRLFTIGSNLAADPETSRMKLPSLEESDIYLLENEIDMMDQSLPELKSFILPRGHLHVSYCHVARCVCRRAERNSVSLSETETIDPLILKYLNRLSDYLFTLARKLAMESGVVEVQWRARP